MRVYGYEYISFTLGLLIILTKTTMVIHLSACFFIMIGLENMHDSKGWIQKQILINVDKDQLDLKPNQNLMPYFFQLYIPGIYFIGTTYSTIGFGDILPQSMLEYYIVSFFMVIFLTFYYSFWRLSFFL